MATQKKSSGSGSKSKRTTKNKMEKVMHEYKHGELKSGGKKKVKSRKQAIAIGLSEARRAGGNVPAKKKSASKKSSGAKKSSSSKKSTTKKGGAKKSSSKKSSSKK